MNNIPTAGEFLLTKGLDGDKEKINQILRDFAKLHVEAALKAAAEKAEVIMVPNCNDHTPYYGPCISCGSSSNYEVPSNSVNEDSILTAYPSENIK